MELFVLHYLKYVFQVQPQNIKCLMMKVLCFSFLIYSTWDFLGDVHRVLLPINTTDINTELKFGVRIPSTQKEKVKVVDSIATISWQMIILTYYESS